MIRPFGLRDLLAVQRLQRQGVWLDLWHYLMQQHSPLRTALISPVPWRGTGLASYVRQDRTGVTGFVQVLQRAGRPEADILFVAPGLDDSTAEPVWQELIEGCIRSAGHQSLRRLFASSAEDGPEIPVLAGLSFAAYTCEEILVRDRPPARSRRVDETGMRPQQAEDGWWLRRLYGLFTPSPVQLAEGMGDKEEPTSLPLAWWEMSQQRGFVMAQGGEVTGAIQVASGRRGHWLMLLGDPEDRSLMAALLRQGLGTLAGSRWPVYCAVRDYQGGQRSVLEEHGFAFLTRRSRLVKHMLVRVRMPERAPVPSLAIEQSS